MAKSNCKACHRRRAETEKQKTTKDTNKTALDALFVPPFPASSGCLYSAMRRWQALFLLLRTIGLTSESSEANGLDSSISGSSLHHRSSG